MVPAYRRRGWSLPPLVRYRKRKAVILADALDSPLFSNEERARYRNLLIRLGDSFPRFLLFHIGATAFSDFRSG